MNFTVPRFARIMGLENCPGTTEVGNMDQPKWDIFPNPFKNEFQIQIPSSMQGASFRLKNYLGQTVAFLNDMKSLGFNWNLSHLQTGFYMVEVQTNQGSFQKKVLKIE